MPSKIDWDAVKKFLEEAVGEYFKTAPEVSRYLEDFYIRLNDRPFTVSVMELRLVEQLWTEQGWMHPNFAQNHICHALSYTGQKTLSVDF